MHSPPPSHRLPCEYGRSEEEPQPQATKRICLHENGKPVQLTLSVVSSAPRSGRQRAGIGAHRPFAFTDISSRSLKGVMNRRLQLQLIKNKFYIGIQCIINIKGSFLLPFNRVQLSASACTVLLPRSVRSGLPLPPFWG